MKAILGSATILSLQALITMADVARLNTSPLKQVGLDVWTNLQAASLKEPVIYCFA